LFLPFLGSSAGFVLIIEPVCCGVVAFGDSGDKFWVSFFAL
jgi:hypothetical protein